MMRVRRSAEVSPCGQYRWWLRRSWEGGDGRGVCFVMLNPSTADAEHDDPTIRRCLGFAQRWGFSHLSIRNLFPYRATDSKALLRAQAPDGGHRGDVELLTARSAHLVVAAWGAWVPYERDLYACALFQDVPLWCLGTTKHGHPRHPLYVRGDHPLVRYLPQQETTT